MGDNEEHQEFQKYSEKMQLISESEEEQNKGIHKQMQKSRLRRFGIPLLLLSLTFFTSCSESLLTPFFPPVAYSKGVSEPQIGIVFASYELSKFIFSPIAGFMIVKVNPKIMSVFGAIVVSLTTFAFGAVLYVDDSLYFLLCVLVRFLAGVGCAAIAVSTMSILLKTSPYETGTVVGLVETVLSVGYLTGRVMGAGLYAWVGYACSFFMVGSLLVILTILVAIFVPQTDPAEVKDKKGMLSLLRIPGVVIVFFIALVYQAVSNCRLSFFSIYLTQTFHRPTAEVGLWFTPLPMLYILCVPVTAALVNRGYSFSIMTILTTISAIFYLLIGPSPLLNFIFHEKLYFWLTITIHLLMPITRQGAFVPPFKATTNLAEVNGYPKDSIKMYGMVAGITNSANGFGMMIGPVMGGILIHQYGYSWSMTIMSGLQFIMVAITILYLIIMKMNKWPIAPVEDSNEKDQLVPKQMESVRSMISAKFQKFFNRSINKGDASGSHDG